MHRRKFLGTLAVGLGATAFPVWLSRSFGLHAETCPEDPVTPAAPPVDPPRAPVCGSQPGAATKPVLVLVIPDREHHRAQYDRGHAFGEILNHGSDEQRGLFALFDVVCRRIDQLPADVQSAVHGEPLMIVLDPHGLTPVRTLDAPLPPQIDPFTWKGPRWPSTGLDAAMDQRIDERIAVIAGLLELAASRAALFVQAARERLALPCAEVDALHDLPETLHTLTPADVDRAAAITVLTARAADEDTRARLWALLAAAVQIRLGDRPVDGAPWARGTDCGFTVEGAADHSHSVSCGQGHVPARSARFLKFFAARW